MVKTIHYVEGREVHISFTDAIAINYYTLCGISWTKIKNTFILHHISNNLGEFNSVTCNKCKKEMKKRDWLEEVSKGSLYPILTSKPLKGK